MLDRTSVQHNPTLDDLLVEDNKVLLTIGERPLPVHVCPDAVTPLRGPGAGGVETQRRGHLPLAQYTSPGIPATIIIIIIIVTMIQKTDYAHYCAQDVK